VVLYAAVGNVSMPKERRWPSVSVFTVNKMFECAVDVVQNFLQPF
jgi:hypothetical protein